MMKGIEDVCVCVLYSNSLDKYGVRYFSLLRIHFFSAISRTHGIPTKLLNVSK